MSDDATAQVRSARRLKYSAARTGEDHQDTSAIIRRDEECPFVNPTAPIEPVRHARHAV
ncbi:hypothetical protein D805_1192 [Bifidobacterium thermophilum RBL67]|uniref:Uncharacterized protein n=1 Tax=Bifidobacterium thermophilum RBL67 TaxID=1254439 RepID=M4RH19_9BIFI|nr:hypothetical protein D805_1192 [Bifidobacterium thermophilum RBL67]